MTSAERPHLEHTWDAAHNRMAKLALGCTCETDNFEMPKVHQEVCKFFYKGEVTFDNLMDKINSNLCSREGCDSEHYKKDDLAGEWFALREIVKLIPQDIMEKEIDYDYNNWGIDTYNRDDLCDFAIQLGRLEVLREIKQIIEKELK